ncbi:MAG TPA: class I SAM-dependent methyltransferase [Polyangia bacterium]|jgi:O-methyltransferase involved in polyketide biosynthesis
MSFEKVSLTAKLTAYMRRYSDIPFAQDVARFVRAEEAFDELLRAHQLSADDLSWYAPIFEIRYKSIAAVLRASGARQVLELASGWSLRGLAMTEDPGLIYVESDLEALTTEKRGLVEEVRRQHGLGGRENFHLAVANALELPQLTAATTCFEVTRPIAVVSEGLLQYLSRPELETVTQNVRALLTRFGGLWITPDFSLKDDSGPISERQRRFRAIIAGATDRQLHDSAFDDEAALRAFLARFDLVAERLSQVEQVPDIVSLQALGLAPELLARLKPRLKLWLLRPT